MVMKIAIYSRVSQDDVHSIENQISRCKAYLEAQGYEVAGVFTDVGVSGSIPIFERPQGKMMYDHMITGKADGMIALNLSRLFRNTQDAIAVADQMEKLGKSMILLDMHMDTSTPYGRAFYTIMNAMNQLERDQARERTRSVMQNLKSNLKVYGNVPYGFDRQGKDLVLNKGEMRVVRKIFMMHEEGHSNRAIARQLTNWGIPTKTGKSKTWAFQSIGSILNNKDFYKLYL